MGIQPSSDSTDFQSLVDQYGGAVSVRDNEPTGSVFEFRLRRAE